MNTGFCCSMRSRMSCLCRKFRLRKNSEWGQVPARERFENKDLRKIRFANVARGVDSVCFCPTAVVRCGVFPSFPRKWDALSFKSKMHTSQLMCEISPGSASSEQATTMLSNPAGERNKEPILAVLKQYLAADQKLAAFEVASGPGTHVSLFAQHFPLVTWQPSDLDPHSLHSIQASVQQHGLTNVLPPLSVDVSRPLSEWSNGMLSLGAVDLIVCINMIHISPWSATQGLFKAAGQLLKPGGYFFTYGPYMVDGKITPESNVSFNESLKSRNPSWGLRDISNLKKLAEDNGIHLVHIHDMPSNNKTLVWQKAAE